jgi:hypothetical protein
MDSIKSRSQTGEGDQPPGLYMLLGTKGVLLANINSLLDCNVVSSRLVYSL